MHSPVTIHASCVSRDGLGVILLGASGCGKSELALRLLDRGFALVADDRVELEAGWARAPAALSGLLEVRGLGIQRVPFRDRAKVALAVTVAREVERLPSPAIHAALGVPLVTVDATAPSAAQRIEWALDCALGRAGQIAGAFA